MKRLLLDSHSFLWFVYDDPRLSRMARALIEDPDSQALFSPATVWELSIKAGLGRLDLRPSPVAFFEAQSLANDFTLLPSSYATLRPPARSDLRRRTMSRVTRAMADAYRDCARPDLGASRLGNRAKRRISSGSPLALAHSRGVFAQNGSP